MNDLLDYAKALLGHVVPSGDLFTVLKRTLVEGVERLEQKKFGKAARTRTRRGAPKGRYVPRDLRRTVWQRDGGQCTFVSDAGKRCPACSRIEFDHVEPVARGGETTVANLRLRCRAHNQYAAECMLGAGFMARKRQEAKATTAKCRTKVGAKSPSRAPSATELAAEAAMAKADTRARCEEVIPWLRELGFRVDEAKRGAAMCAEMADAPLEDRVRVALSGLASQRFRRNTHAASPGG